MRLVTYSRLGVPSIGVELKDGILDIPDAASRFGRAYHVKGFSFPNEMIDLLSWESGIEVVKQILERYTRSRPVERPLLFSLSNIKIIALGLNYKDHVEETKKEAPPYPVIFSKFSSSVVGPDDPVPMPRVSSKIDWEIELGVVIGRVCRNVAENDALGYVAGYTVVNDLGARDLQKSDGQWVRSKSLDGFCPMGPVIVTADELGDGSGLRMQTRVNGVTKQDSNTSNMIFGVKKIVSYLSHSFTLEPGDIIATGTPGGVGSVRSPPEYLKVGDEIELQIERIGTLRNRMARPD
jgi:2-keto-4-pentenoate hydratase/2-oxohepta-3-ene-1,7-dioic acid hydratase in catechol pathway